MAKDTPASIPPGKRSTKPPRSITAALRRIVVPALRQRDFTGELPHLRRLADEGTSTFTLQISKWGGEFVIELGRAPAGPYSAGGGRVIDASELTTSAMRLADRARLRPLPGSRREVWFSYAPTRRERVRWLVARLLHRPPGLNRFERAAARVLALLPECDRWWAGEDGLEYVRSFREQERAQATSLGRPPKGWGREGRPS